MKSPRSILLAASLFSLLALSGHPAASTQGVAASAEVAAAPDAAEPARAPVASTELFELWSDLDVNLHHFLYAWARQERPLEHWDPLEVQERDELEQLEPEDRAAWSGAVAFYRRELAPRDLLFGAGMLELRDVVAGLHEEAFDDEPRRVARILDQVRPIYRKRWWPRHDKSNRDWIAALVPALDEHEREISTRLAAAWGATWPQEKIRADVTPYPNNLGAYTTGKPHITISSSDPAYRMPTGLEMIFHESSHGDFLSGPLNLHLQRAFGYRDERVPRWFWHLTLFYNAGEVTQQVLAGAGQPEYVHMGRGRIYVSSEARRRQSAALDRHWRPFLAGLPGKQPDPIDAARAEALAAIVDELATPDGDAPR